VRHPHWHGVSLRDRLLYVVAWCMGVVMGFGLLFLVDWLSVEQWWAEHKPGSRPRTAAAHKRPVHRLAG
jgi:hypothetical protein